MDDIIEKLYSGTLNVCKDIYNLTDDKLFNECTELINNITEIVGQELGSKLDAAQTLLIHDVSLHSFEYGLKLGINLAKPMDSKTKTS